MKKLLFFAMLVLAANVFAQTPMGFNYQAVIRDNSGNIIKDKTVGIKISILKGSASGNAVYMEEHSEKTSAQGILNLVIGHGTSSQKLEDIDWSASTYFMKVEVDANGGSTYKPLGTTQLLAVPYAMHAKTVENDMVDDADADPMNENISSFELHGTSIEIKESGNSHMVDLQSLLQQPQDFTMTSMNGKKYQVYVDDEGNLKSIPVHAKIAVISDPHYFDPDLLIKNGMAFQTYLAKDRKLIAESHAIITSALQNIIKQKPDVLLIPGDLTKDGEKSSHEKLAMMLGQVRMAGIKVIVAPGNHDINNPESYSFDGDTFYHVPNIDPAGYNTIYGKMNFEDSIATDPHSLSFVSEPVEGLWVVSLDVCKYDSNMFKHHSETSGRMKTETLNWLKYVLSEAHSKGKVVIAMMHHGLVEHYVGQKTMFPEYVIDNWESLSDTLIDNGLKYMLTGHYHANDITARTFNGKTVYDIETGSLVTYPCPVRFMTLTDSAKLFVSTTHITTINYNTYGKPFPEYALEYLNTGMLGISKFMLMMPPYNLPEVLANMLAPVVTEAFVAHYGGDEGSPSAASMAILNSMIASGNPQQIQLAYAILSVFNDLPVEDNNVILK
jgi:hypothetical protein